MRDLFGDNVLKFGLAAFQARPGNDEARLGRGRLVGSNHHGLDFGIKLDDGGEERPLVEFLKNRAEDDGAGDVAHIGHRRVLEDRGDQRLVAEDEFVKLGPLFDFGELVLFQDGKNRHEELGLDQPAVDGGTILAEPEKEIAGDVALADEAVDRGLNVGFAPGGLESFRDHLSDAAVGAREKTEEQRGPRLRQTDAQGLQQLGLARTGQGVEKVAQRGRAERGQRRDGPRTGLGLASGLDKKLVAGQGQLDLNRQLRLGDLGHRAFEQFGHFVENHVAFDFGPILRQGAEGGENGFGPVGQTQVFQRGITQGAGRVEFTERLVLFARHIKVAVLFQGAFGAVPPFLVIGAGDHVGSEQGLDAVGGGLRTEAADAVPDDRNRIFLGFFAQVGGRFDLLHEHMVGRQRSQRFGGIGVLHDMPVLRFEINDDAFGDAIPILDPAKAPTAVDTVGSGRKQFELIR